MYPHERSLVARLKDEPFALVGVNSDGDLGELKAAMEKENITWRSFWDESTSGPIASRWNIQGWPSIFVRDAHGVIRYRDVRGEAMDEAVGALLAELATEK